MAHIITGVTGDRVLSLPWSVAQSGEIAGPMYIIIVFATINQSLFFYKFANSHIKIRYLNIN